MNRKALQTRMEIASKLSCEETRQLYRLANISRLLTEYQDNPQEFQENWVAPLMDAGISIEAVYGYIVEFHLQPN